MEKHTNNLSSIFQLEPNKILSDESHLGVFFFLAALFPRRWRTEIGGHLFPTKTLILFQF